MVKKIHLSICQIHKRIQKLQIQKLSDQWSKNKTKRRRILHQLSQLQKALSNPNQLWVDPQQVVRKRQQQQQRRVQKKLKKKQQLLHELKNKKRHQKRCLKCGARDHLLKECATTKVGFCYKCGSLDHSHLNCTKLEYTLADCFYCGKTGHIARDCQLNQKGLYKKGGSCFSCNSVRHTLKHCPLRNQQGVKSGKYSNKQSF